MNSIPWRLKIIHVFPKSDHFKENVHFLILQISLVAVLYYDRY